MNCEPISRDALWRKVHSVKWISCLITHFRFRRSVAFAGPVGRFGKSSLRTGALVACLMVSTLSCQDIQRPDLASLIFSSVSGGDKIGIISSDLSSTGRFSVMSLDGFQTDFYVNVHSDALARNYRDRVYVINRLGRDNIQVLNPLAGYFTEAEISVGTGSNPQDIAFSNGRAFVTRYERTDVSVLTDSLIPVGSVDLGFLAEPVSAGGAPDGLPEISSVYAYQGRIYVSVQRLDRNHPVLTYAPSDASYLVEIDAGSLAITGVHTFQSTNPFGKLKLVNFQGVDHLVISTPAKLGFNFAIDGGVEAFNLQTRQFRSGFLYTEAAAGGDILDVVIKNDTTGYAVVEYADFSISLQRFNPLTGGFVSQLAYYPASFGFFSGLELSPDGRLYAGDVGITTPGVRIFDTSAGDIPLGVVPLLGGLRPIDLIYIEPL
ncbi:MAG TPA: hypothetical protein DEA96_12820 [Leptospiraceae bacterium]|nr:hypothetical protein [Spirochaetaceae bacterium]HBS05845.1 hypothetical protein [Leptospiraceae bacterium]